MIQLRSNQMDDGLRNSGVGLQFSIGTPELAECEVCRKLFDQGGSTTRWSNKPTFPALQQAAAGGCRHCTVVWQAVTLVFPDAQLWTRSLIHGFVRSAESKSLRIGIIKDARPEFLALPREWIDIRVIPDEGIEDLQKNPVHEPCSPEWIGMIQSWVNECDSNHTECSQYTMSLPTRLLDLSLCDGSADVTLVETKTITRERYIALSYCWGKSVPICTTADNYEKHRVRIQWASLPQLFRDIIAICRLLRVRYLWIDSMCIIQGNDEDWASESSRMGFYCGNAWLTIAADASRDSLQSCLPLAGKRRSTTIDLNGKQTIAVYKLPIHFDMGTSRLSERLPDTMPLFGRSWAFQERLISRRVLHMGPDEVLWECCAAMWCGCGESIDFWHGGAREPITPFRTAHHSKLLQGGLIGHWHDLLQLYLLRSLTYEVDKLNGIVGLAKQLKDAETTRLNKDVVDTLGHYVAGIWTAAIPATLLWTNLRPEAVERNPDVPSWSWASLTGPWTYSRPPDPSNFTVDACVTDAPSEKWSAEGLFDFKKRAMIISGYVIDGELTTYRPTSRPIGEKISSIAEDEFACWRVKNAKEDARLLIDVDTMSTEDAEAGAVSMPCMFLQLGTTHEFLPRSWGLILQSSSAYDGCYERVGVVSGSPEWFSEATHKTGITIV